MRHLSTAATCSSGHRGNRPRTMARGGARSLVSLGGPSAPSMAPLVVAPTRRIPPLRPSNRAQHCRLLGLRPQSIRKHDSLEVQTTQVTRESMSNRLWEVLSGACAWCKAFPARRLVRWFSGTCIEVCLMPSRSDAVMAVTASLASSHRLYQQSSPYRAHARPPAQRRSRPAA
jgi:hypothetical protein